MSIWESNMKLLKAKNPILSDKIEGYEARNVEMLISKCGLYTAKYRGYLINSLYEPLREARSRVGAVNNLDKCTMIICAGLGLGYEINEIIDRLHERSIIVLIVTNYDILKCVMERIDLSKILEFGRLAILDGTEESFKYHLRKISKELVYFTGEIAYFEHPMMKKFNSEIIEKRMSEVKDVLITEILNFGNSIEDNLEGLERTIQNRHSIIETPDLKSLKGYFKGVPAICVASGPSLEKNINYLKQAQGKAVIFGAQTILDRLRLENIKFNFAGVIERPEAVYDLNFKGKPIEEDVVFLGDSVVYHKIFDEHRGKNVVLFRETTYVESSFSEKLDNLNKLNIGSSSAHVGFAVAEYLGFSPIILVGQDLSYSDEGEDHAKGTVYHDEEHKKLFSNKRIILEDDVYMNGTNGGMVRSTQIWKLFKEFFEEVIRNENVFCINATEGGAHIEGTRVMTLKDAVDQYCNRTVSFDPSIFASPNEKEKKKRTRLLEKEIEAQLNDAKKVKGIAANIKLILDRFVKENCIINKKYDIRDYINVISSAVDEIVKCRLPAFVMQAVIINFVRKNKAFIDVDNTEVALAWYEMNFDFFNTVEGIMDIMIELYEKISTN